MYQKQYWIFCKNVERNLWKKVKCDLEKFLLSKCGEPESACSVVKCKLRFYFWKEKFKEGGGRVV